MYNNYNNDNFNNNIKPLFANEFQNPAGIINSENNYQNNFNAVNQDAPPVLEPIKNLSDATVVNAPSMEVLDPMNIMPETLDRKEPPKQIDPLVAYDNGINYQNASVEFQENNYITSPETTNNFQIPPVGNNFPTGSFNFDIQNENSSNTLSSNITENQNYESVNLPLSNLETEQPNKIKIEYENIISQDKNEIVVDNTPEQEKVEEQPSYEIVEKQISSEEKNPMLDLGIDNAYDDIDMLDIVDVDEEKNIEESGKQTEEPDIETTNEEKPLLADNVNEIRKLINQLKEKGIKIDFEEFDFEHMYQLIIKIEK